MTWGEVKKKIDQQLETRLRRLGEDKEPDDVQVDYIDIAGGRGEEMIVTYADSVRVLRVLN